VVGSARRLYAATVGYGSVPIAHERPLMAKRTGAGVVKNKALRVARALAKEEAKRAEALVPPDVVDPAIERQQRQQQALDDTQTEIDKLARRVRNPAGKLRRAKFIAAVLALRMQHFSKSEIAGHLGVSEPTVKRALVDIRANSAASDQLMRLDQIGIPLAVDNVINGLVDGDKDYTQDLLKGRGMYRTHKSIDAQVTKTTLEMKIVFTDPTPEQIASARNPRAGSILGIPESPKALPDIPTVAIPESVGVGTALK
jgi:predicted transcriptional regulator